MNSTEAGISAQLEIISEAEDWQIYTSAVEYIVNRML